MFFKSAETKKTLTEATPDKTIYLLSVTPQSLYLSYHFANNGFFPIILETPDKAKELEKEEFILKEDRLLQRSKFKIHANYQMQKEGCLLIIPQTRASLKNKLLLLSPTKLKNASVVCLDFEQNLNFLSDLLQKQVIRGTMSGFIEYGKKQLTLSGRQPAITLSCEEDHAAVQTLKNALNDGSINIDILPDAAQNFWSAFIPYAAASLLSATSGKTISAMTKNPEGRQYISDIINELVLLAQRNNVDVSSSEMLRKIYNIPYSYTYPLQQNPSNKDELNRFFSVLMQKNETTGRQTPLLRSLLKQIYNKTLA